MKKDEMWGRIRSKEKMGGKRGTDHKDFIHKTEQNWRKSDVEYGRISS